MTLKIGIIGLGVMGADHAKIIYSKTTNSTISAVYDSNIEHAQNISKLIGNPQVKDTADELINSPDVDAIMIISPDETHAELTLKCIDQKKPVLCEKPLSHSVTECKNIIDAEEKKGKRLVQVGYMRRFDPSYLEMKKNLNTQNFGKALLLHCVHRQIKPPNFFKSLMSITNGLVHEFDIIRWLLETEIVEIEIIKSSIRKQLDYVDPLLVIIKCANGIIVDVEYNSNTYGYDVKAELVCEEGTIIMSPPRKNELMSSKKHFFSYANDWRPRFADAYRNQNQAWINSIVNNTISEGSSAWDGMIAAKIAEAGVKSFEQEKSIIIELQEIPDFYKIKK